jgi:hypothetical protein
MADERHNDPLRRNRGEEDGSTERSGFGEAGRNAERPVCELIGGPLDGQKRRMPDHKVTLTIRRMNGSLVMYKRYQYSQRFLFVCTQRPNPPADPTNY